MDEGHDDYDDGYDDGAPDQEDPVRDVLTKALVGIVVIAVLVLVGTVLLVRSLGLNQDDSNPVGSGQAATPLPSSALPSPEKSASKEPTDETSGLISPSDAPEDANGDLQLNASPLKVRPMERVNLTGTWKGHDNQTLQVQRWEAGGWQDFGVNATVRVGTFETYVMTGRSGENRFRVVEPGSGKGSNPVVVSIG